MLYAVEASNQGFPSYRSIFFSRGLLCGPEYNRHREVSSVPHRYRRST